jgi:hypothetical protein
MYCMLKVHLLEHQCSPYHCSSRASHLTLLDPSLTNIGFYRFQLTISVPEGLEVSLGKLLYGACVWLCDYVCVCLTPVGAVLPGHPRYPPLGLTTLPLGRGPPSVEHKEYDDDGYRRKMQFSLALHTSKHFVKIHYICGHPFKLVDLAISATPVCAPGV